MEIFIGNSLLDNQIQTIALNLLKINKWKVPKEQGDENNEKRRRKNKIKE